MKISPEMAEALRYQRAEFAREIRRLFKAADEDTQADMLAFFDSGGPRKVERARRAIDGENRSPVRRRR